jgi:hypothetical protein
LNKVAKVVGEYRDGKRSANADAVKAAVGFIPGNNLPPVKAFLDHAILNDILERLNPGYKQRMINNAEKYGTPYFMPPQ